jgi:hypothetical protein
MTTLRGKFLTLLTLAGLLVAGIVWAVGTPYQGPQPIATGAAGKRQPAPTASDGTYLYVTVSWEQGRTAAVSITANGRPVLPSMWTDEGGGKVSYCDVVCTESPSKFSIQVKRGDRVILSAVATAKWGRVYCALRRVGERDAQLVKPAKNSGLEGQVICEQTAR